MDCRNASQGCDDQVRWDATRDQWVHVGTGRAVCAIEFVRTLVATPAGDVWPVDRVRHVQEASRARKI